MIAEAVMMAITERCQWTKCEKFRCIRYVKRVSGALSGYFLGSSRVFQGSFRVPSGSLV